MAANWGSVGWWAVVLVSFPFSVYSLVFLIGDFDVYKKLTIAWNGGNFETAGLHIFNNLRAWQVHVAGALLFMFTAPFQFNPKFREKNPGLHRRMGYAFVLAAVVTAVSVLTVLMPNTEFGYPGKILSTAASTAQLCCVFAAVKAARARQFRVHREYMIRTAAIGYSVINSRATPPLLQNVFGMEYYASFEYGLFLAYFLNVVCAELYILSTSKPSPIRQKVAVKKS